MVVSGCLVVLAPVIVINAATEIYTFVQKQIPLFPSLGSYRLSSSCVLCHYLDLSRTSLWTFYLNFQQCQYFDYVF